MSNLKALKNRIKSVKSTQKMTKAMKMVAASKLRKAKKAVETSRPYSNMIDELMYDLASNISLKNIQDKRFSMLNGYGHSDKNHLLIILSSDRGLCGGLNSSIVRYTKNYIEKLQKEGKEVKIFAIGKKAFEQLKSKYGSMVIETKFGIFKNDINYEIALDISNQITKLFEDNVFDVCDIIFSNFKSAIFQEVEIKQIIPIDTKKTAEKVEVIESPIKYEQSKEKLLYDLLPKNIAVQIYNKLLENSASEQGARMAAMESASNNASEMIKKLTLSYNRTRQANITRELIDIVSGANAI